MASLCISSTCGRRHESVLNINPKRETKKLWNGIFLPFKHADCPHLSSVISRWHYVVSPRAQKLQRKEKTKGCDTPISILDRNIPPWSPTTPRNVLIPGNECEAMCGNRRDLQFHWGRSHFLYTDLPQTIEGQVNIVKIPQLGFDRAALAVAFGLVSKNSRWGCWGRRREWAREKLCTRHWEQYISTGTCQTE